MRRVFLLVYLWALFLPESALARSRKVSPYALRVNLFCESRSGLDKDRIILNRELTALGCGVHEIIHANPREAPLADVNIFCEKTAPDCYGVAPINWFIPNPEWIWQDLSAFGPIDLILCRTNEVERIFRALGKKTYYLGFSSVNMYDPLIYKDYRAFFHLAGNSWQKGTNPILHAWKKYADFPDLTIVHHGNLPFEIPRHVRWLHGWLSSEELQYLINACGIHLCLSETEGFGHYIMEAMSAGAVVITTNAPPMNEFIEELDCLVPYHSSSHQGLATNFYVRPDAVGTKIKQILRLLPEQLAAIGRKNRKNYQHRTKAFRGNLAYLLMVTREQLYE